MKEGRDRGKERNGRMNEKEIMGLGPSVETIAPKMKN